MSSAGVVTRSSTTLVGNEGAWVLAVVGLLVLPGALALLAAAALTPVGPRPV